MQYIGTKTFGKIRWPESYYYPVSLFELAFLRIPQGSELSHPKRPKVQQIRPRESQFQEHSILSRFIVEFGGWGVVTVAGKESGVQVE
eukprot:3544144-Amphidinium_carterae.1